MFGIGGTELFVIVLFAFLLFGPDKLPQMGRTIGRALRQFRATQEKMTAVVQSEVIDPMQTAMKEPAKPRRAVSAASDDGDLDEDAPAASEPARTETFAERRARLAAEKAASEQAAATEAPAADAPSAEQEPDAAPAEEKGPAPAEEEPRRRTAADLYARRPRKGDEADRDASAHETGKEDAE